MSYNSDLQHNNAELQAILDEVNALPNANGVHRWDVTVTNGEGSNTLLFFVEGDQWLMENRDNPNLCVVILPKFTITNSQSTPGMQGIFVASNMKLMQDGNGVGYNSISSYVNQGGYINARMRDCPLTQASDIGDIGVTNSGALFSLAVGDYPVANGDYVIIAFIA